MAFTARTKSYVVDLSLAEDERWATVIEAERKVARKVARQARKSIGARLGPALGLVGWTFGHAYKLYGGRYRGEIESWAEALDVSQGVATMLNCSYELSHVSLCTAGVRWVPGFGLVHVRSMDWPLPAIGAATRLFQFKKGRRRFVAVGIAGFVGVLSGMMPGAYSVTLNWAPAVARPGFDFGPAFLLREVLEECSTYREALAALRDTKLAASVFYVVCGTKRGEACVVERTRDAAAVTKMQGTVMVQANHHAARRFIKNNNAIGDPDDDESLLFDSRERAAVLERALRQVKTRSLDELGGCLDVEPVLNDDTCQQMVSCPKTSSVKVWRWVP